METIVHGLAENNYIVSLANLGGIIAFLLLLLGFLRWAYRFTMAAYDKNIRVAIYRARRRNYRRAKLAALDIHNFVSMIVIQSISVFAAFMTFIVGLVAYAARYTMPAEEQLSTTLQISNYWDKPLATVMLYAPLALVIITIARLDSLAKTTRRVRAKLVDRKIRMTNRQSTE